MSIPSDLACVTRQMRGRKFDVSLILGAANRCRYGCPKAIVCSPLRGADPFPTSFWLTCPWLVRRIGTLESKGGVGALEQWIEDHAPDEWVPFNIDHQRVRLALLADEARGFLRAYRPKAFTRIRSGGVGGIRYGREVNVKCLHLQAASWLALRRHPGKAWLWANGVGEDCGGAMQALCKGLYEQHRSTAD